MIPARWLGLKWLGLVLLSLGLGCARTPVTTLRAFPEMREAVAELPITWVSLPRPAPLPPLDHAALLVPVSFDGVTGKPLYMQVDLGHPATVFYGHKWAHLAPRLRATGQGLSESKGAVQNLRFKVGNLAIAASQVAILPTQGAGIRWDTEDQEIIGTLGADAVLGRTVVMDFKADRIQVATHRALVARPGDRFLPFRIRWRRILLPAQLEAQELPLLYDSGSSAFAFITDEPSWNRLKRPGAVEESFPVKSWKRTLMAHVVATDAKVTVAGVALPVGQVAHMEGTSWWQRTAMRIFGMGAMAGNRLFLGHRVVLDTATRECCVSD
ncbi:MAG: hypothetical protein HY014_01255 [Acidobacteria bacterium]|nr:hypothetical protein [Acidobacteriota bacterium]MBI3486778.1 hypothetical protein [Acidobacteriota bacterium]